MTSFIEGITDEMEAWLAPEPELYPRVTAMATSVATPTTTLDSTPSNVVEPYDAENDSVYEMIQGGDEASLPLILEECLVGGAQSQQ